MANYVPLSEIFSKKILEFIWKILPPNSHFGTLDSRWIVKDAKPEKQLEEAAKKTALLNEKLGKEAQAFDQDLRKKLDLYKPWLTFDQDLMRKLNLMKKGQKSQILLVEGVQYFDSLSR